MDKCVLIVEDESRIREIISDYFTKEGFKVLEAADGKQALELFEENTVDILILDIMMPKLDGWAVCRRIRNQSDIPIIMLTAREEEEDKLLGYELGADDYVTKPFSPKVLVAKVKSLLKRAVKQAGVADSCINLEGLSINKLSRTVKLEDKQIELAHKEYELLLYLVENRGMVLSREKILNNVWGYDYFGDLRTVDTHIKKLRGKLGDKAAYITTVIRSGYKFEVGK
jgi:DNA-binding response OmpR family regulator